MNLPDPAILRAVMQGKGYAWFTNPQGYDLNLVGIRTAGVSGDVFDDWVTVTHYRGDQPVMFPFQATTDPGTFYRENPLNVRGTAILKPGQYRGAYTLGKHRRSYDALVQAKPVTVYRDANRDGVLDTEGMAEDSGFHGVNIHRASAVHHSLKVGKWSAGCQVVAAPEEFAFVIAMCRHAATIYGDLFTYTLLEESDFR